MIGYCLIGASLNKDTDVEQILSSITLSSPAVLLAQ